MSATLQFGTENVLEFDLLDEVLIANCAAPQGKAIVDLPAAVRAAIETPLDFPPLQLAIVPGDKIVIAVDSALPQTTTIVATLVTWLLEHGAEAGDLSVLTGLSENEAADPRSALPADLAAQVGLWRHDPNNESQHCHLANADDEHEIRVHRALFDADFVLPVGCLRAETAWLYHGVHNGLFPEFFDGPTQRRIHDADQTPTSAVRKRLTAEINHTAWNLGVQFTVQVIPGADDEILSVIAGNPPAVQTSGQLHHANAWRFSPRQRAELVIAAITGGPEQQTWANVGRAVAAALPLVVADGAIVICTSLTAAPGPAVQRLAGARDTDQALRRIRKEHSADAPTAAKLVQAMEDVKLYLYSGLDEQMIEDLGIAPITEADDLTRLARRAHSCILLGHAQHVATSVAEDGA